MIDTSVKPLSRILFRLRILLLLLEIATSLDLSTYEAYRQTAADTWNQSVVAVALKRSGCQVTYAIYGNLLSLRNQINKVLHAINIGQVTSVTYPLTALDADLRYLPALKNLSHLNLYGRELTDEGLSNIRGLTTLKVLSINSPDVTDAGLVNLRDLKELVHLSMGETSLRGYPNWVIGIRNER